MAEDGSAKHELLTGAIGILNMGTNNHFVIGFEACSTGGDVYS